MAADTDTDDVREVAREAAEQVVEEAVPEGVVTEEELDSKLNEAVDALADETRDVIQKADTASTPTPTAGGGSTSVNKDDLFSGSAGGDSE